MLILEIQETSKTPVLGIPETVYRHDTKVSRPLSLFRHAEPGTTRTTRPAATAQLRRFQDIDSGRKHGMTSMTCQKPGILTGSILSLGASRCTQGG